MRFLASRYVELLAQLALVREAAKDFRKQLKPGMFIEAEVLERWLKGLESLTGTDENIPEAVFWCEDCQRECEVEWNNRAPVCHDCKSLRVLVDRRNR